MLKLYEKLTRFMGGAMLEIGKASWVSRSKQQDGVVGRTVNMSGWLFELSFFFNQEVEKMS